MYITDLEYLVKILKQIELIGRELRGYDCLRTEFLDKLAEAEARRQMEPSEENEDAHNTILAKIDGLVLAIGKANYKLEVNKGILKSMGYFIDEGVVKRTVSSESYDDGTVSEDLVDNIRLVI